VPVGVPVGTVVLTVGVPAGAVVLTVGVSVGAVVLIVGVPVLGDAEGSGEDAEGSGEDTEGSGEAAEGSEEPPWAPGRINERCVRDTSRPRESALVKNGIILTKEDGSDNDFQ
jgi:hypothetical protein